MKSICLSEMDIELSEINRIFEQINPPENKVDEALKLYHLRQMESNGCAFGADLGLCEFHFAFSFSEKREEYSTRLFLLSFNNCCHQLEVISIEKNNFVLLVLEKAAGNALGFDSI